MLDYFIQHPKRILLFSIALNLFIALVNSFIAYHKLSNRDYNGIFTIFLIILNCSAAAWSMYNYKNVIQREKLLMWDLLKD